MKDEVKKILDKFDKKLENYELDKKWGELSVDSIGHLFPNEMIIIKHYITNLEQENERLKEIVENLATFTVCGDRKQIKNTAQYKLEIAQDKIDKAIHRIQLLQMDGEVCIKDLGLIVRDLTGGDEE